MIHTLLSFKVLMCADAVVLDTLVWINIHVQVFLRFGSVEHQEVL